MKEIEEKLYNMYLRVNRTRQGKPYQPRKNFDKFEEKKEYPHIQRLGIFFEHYPHMFREEYFHAPYEMYSDVNQKLMDGRPLHIKFYASHKAFVLVCQYLRMMQLRSPDTLIGFWNTSGRFIVDYCKNKNITLKDYIQGSSESPPLYFEHLKNHQISWYFLFVIPNALSIVNAMSRDDYAMFFGELDWQSLQKNLNKDEKAKIALEKIFKHCEKLLA
jgi:hypothetical protein